MKTLGIIGGLGPETTSKIYHSVIDSFRRNKKDEYPSIVIYNLPFPFIIENEAIVKGINSHKMLPYLIRGAKILEKAGATFGILPCNTLHKYIQEIRNSVKIPILSVLEETLAKLNFMGLKNIGILATQSTVDSKIYDYILIKNEINVLYPTKREQRVLSKVIVEILNGRKSKIHSKKLRKIIDSLQEQGVEGILLACTDLQTVSLKTNISIPIIDTTEILIEASVRELFGK